MKIADVVRIDELTRPEYRYEAERLLWAAGFHSLGSGAFASVFGKPGSPFVVKLFDKDDAYRHYLRLILSVSNPHFPVVKGRPMQITEEYWGVRLELLEPIEGFNIQLAKAAKQYIVGFLDIRETERYDYLKATDAEYAAFAKHYSNNPKDLMRTNSADRAGDRRNMAVFEQHYPDLAEACQLIVQKVLIPADANGDLHVGNFMARGTVLVITDPIGFSGEESPTTCPQRVATQRELPLGSNLGYQPDYMRLSDKLPAGIKTSDEPSLGTTREPSLRLMHPDNT